MDLNNVTAIAYYNNYIRNLAKNLFLQGVDRDSIYEELKSRFRHYITLITHPESLISINVPSIVDNFIPLPEDEIFNGYPKSILIECDFTHRLYHICDMVRFQNSASEKVLAVYRGQVNNSWWWWKQAGRYTNYQYPYNAFDAYKKSPRFWKSPSEDANVAGFEFEWKFKSLSDKINFAQAIFQNHKPCICEKDGSLDGGALDGPSLELITPPWTFDDGLKKIESILNLAHRHKIVEPGNGYGWHITINCWGMEMVNRIIFIVNHKSLRAFWLNLGRRDTSRDQKDYAKFIHYDSLEEVAEINHSARWSSKPVDHFYSTFMRKNTSVELRFPKSTIDFSQIRYTMLILKRLLFFCKYSTDNFFQRNFMKFPNIYVCNRI